WPADELLVATIADPIFADDDKDHVPAAVAEFLGYPHEDVEAAHRLEAAGNVGHDPHVVRDRVLSDLARLARAVEPRPPQLRVDAVEDDADFVVKLLRQPAALPVRRAVASVAVFQVKQQHRIARPSTQPVDLSCWELRPKTHFRLRRPVKPFEVVDDRAV